ncbi:MAG: hypothetical protein K2M15_07130 [Oscillospiraceae bacterium]|nr:hypothetical protein [Oscillospiraceae bacterium]MDE7171237.1 hypothetical protein [Oscillospiraceae bacterium]
MKRNYNFHVNPAFFIGVTLLWIGVFIRNVLELAGPMATAAHFICGAGCGLAFIGLLYGSPKTRHLFDRFCTFKHRLLGREDAN